MIKCTRFITKRIRKRETDKEKKNMEMNQKQYGKDHEKKEREKQTGRYIILAADDETELLDILELYLEREGIGICKAGDGIEAMKIFGREEVHLALLDIMMPGLDGFAVLRKIRQGSRIPVIMLTAKSQDYDKILGLETGADDYITKPYNPLEVVARIKAQLRRCYDYRDEAEEKAQVLTLRDVVMNVPEGTLERGGRRIELTPKEFGILQMLLEHPGYIFTKQQIFERVWEEMYAGDDNTVMVHISNLRSKLEEGQAGKTPFVRTVKGLGYKVEKEES